jgi:hypothetical protein
LNRDLLTQYMAAVGTSFRGLGKAVKSCERPQADDAWPAVGESDRAASYQLDSGGLKC